MTTAMIHCAFIALAVSSAFLLMELIPAEVLIITTLRPVAALWRYYQNLRDVAARDEF